MRRVCRRLSTALCACPRKNWLVVRRCVGAGDSIWYRIGEEVSLSLATETDVTIPPWQLKEINKIALTSHLLQS